MALKWDHFTFPTWKTVVNKVEAEVTKVEGEIKAEFEKPVVKTATAVAPEPAPVAAPAVAVNTTVAK
jgi:hypothetical protein